MLLAVIHISTEELTLQTAVDLVYAYDKTIKKYLIEILAAIKMMSSLYTTLFYKIILLWLLK